MMSESAKLTRGDLRGHLITQALPITIGVAAIMSIGLAAPRVIVGTVSLAIGWHILRRCQAWTQPRIRFAASDEPMVTIR